MNFERYPWLSDLSSVPAKEAIAKARQSFKQTGAVTFPEFITKSALADCVNNARAQEDDAFTTDDSHTAHLKPSDPSVPANSVRNHKMSTKVAAIAFDELPPESELPALYEHPSLRQVVAMIVHGNDDDDGLRVPKLYLSEDPVGRCYINVFRPGHQLSFHFDESEFSTTLMLQEARQPDSGLFQYTDPFKQPNCNEKEHARVLDKVAKVLKKHDKRTQNVDFYETSTSAGGDLVEEETPELHTLKFAPGTLSIFSGSKSLHRVTEVKGDCSRLVAVLTFPSKPGFKNSPEVQEIFFGRKANKG